MKVFFLEQDTKLQDEVEYYLNTLRLKMNIKKVQSEEELYNDVKNIDTYKLFILNLKDPTNTKAMEFIRKNGSVAPILLILEKGIDSNIYKTLYYLSYNHVIAKDFVPEEIAYSIYKLCGIWNDDVFFLSNGVYFDSKKEMFIYKDESIIFGKKEALLLKYLFLKSPSLLSCEEINSLVYENEVISQERIRSLIKQVRKKLPFDIITTVKGEGYQILSSTKANINKVNPKRLSQLEKKCE